MYASVGRVQRIARSPWADVLSAAGFMFLLLASIGALLVVGIKLQAPSLGAGASAISVLAGIVIAGLAILGTPTQIGDATVTVLPLGGLLAFGAAASWSAALTVRRIDAPETAQRVRWGAALGPCLAVICAPAAILFRVRDAVEPLSSHAWWAFALGLLWGSLFGALGGLMSAEGLRSLSPQFTRLQESSSLLHGSTRVAVSTVGIGLALAALATMAWIVALLAGGPVREFGTSDAFAAVIHFVLFLPNAVVWVLTVALGAGLHLAAGLAESRQETEAAVRVMSLWSWPDGAPWFAYTLLAIPALATVGGALFVMRRGLAIRPDALLLAALFVALFVYVVGSLAGARVAPGLLRPRAFAYIAPDAGRAAMLAFLWTAGGGAIALALGRGSTGFSASTDPYEKGTQA